MTPREIRNMPASVHDRLLNRAREAGRPFQEMLEHYAMERFLYRLGVSDYAGRFVLKGGLMLHAWGAAVSRPTRDIDLLGHAGNDVSGIVDVIKDVCRQAVADDGLVFDHQSCSGETINPEKEYTGVRVRFTAYLDRAKVPMQVDVGFGDVIVPEAVETEYPSLLGHTAARVLGYTRESVIAEKLEAMLKRGEGNSRMKDFLDIWLLSQQCEFSGEVLCLAVQKTLQRRGFAVRRAPVCLTHSFAADQSRQEAWRAVLDTSGIADAPLLFTDVVQRIATFVEPLLDALCVPRIFTGVWLPQGPWRPAR